MQLRCYTALTLLLPIASAAATIRYSYEDLGDFGSGAVALNNRGWITGSSFIDGRYVPVRYRPGIGLEQLSRTNGIGTDVNDAGTVVGYLFHNYIANAIVRPAGQAWEDLGTLGGKSSEAHAINEAGQIVGRSGTGTGNAHAFLYSDEGGMVDLGTLGGTDSWAFEINESGQILGKSRFSPTSHESHTFLYDPVLGMVDIDAQIGRRFFIYQGTGGLADNGTVAGVVADRVAVFSLSTGLRKLGTLGGPYSKPVAINDRGWVVGDSTTGSSMGMRPFLYVYGRGLMELNSLIEGAPIGLDRAIDINDRDQILARNGTTGHYYLLTRIREESSLAEISNPEPSTWMLLGLGLAAVALARRRIVS